jgi:hypothetical protein
MKKDRASLLRAEVEKLRAFLSTQDRPSNYLKEDFKTNRESVLSEDAGYSIYEKSGGKRVLFFWCWHRDRWWNFPPTCGHLIGMEALMDLYRRVEDFNYERSFSEVEEST